MLCILLPVPFPPSVTVLGIACNISVPGLSRSWSVFTDRLCKFGYKFTEVNLFTNLLLGCLVYLVCKLDNKICSIFGFQGTASNCCAITREISLRDISQNNILTVLSVIRNRDLFPVSDHW